MKKMLIGRAALGSASDFTLPPEAVTETFAILANRGAGKSTAATRFVEQMYATGLPVVVLDVKGDWWGIRSSSDGKGPGLPFIIFGGDHADVPLEPTAGQLLADLIVDQRIAAVLDMSGMSKTKARSFATAFAEQLYHRNRDPLHVVIEEADVLVPQRATAETARLLGAFEDIAKRGRSRGLGLTLISQRSQEVSKSVLELMETVVLLRTSGPRSIGAIKDWISVNTDAQASPLVIGELPSLPTGTAWVWSPSFLHLLTKVKIDMFETFDSHATPKPGQQRVVPKGHAEVDLAALGEQIAATVQRATDNDPKLLRAEVAKLRKELADLRAQPGEIRTVEVEVIREVEVPAAIPPDVLTTLDRIQVATRELDAMIAEQLVDLDTVAKLIKEAPAVTRTVPAVKSPVGVLVGKSTPTGAHKPAGGYTKPAGPALNDLYVATPATDVKLRTGAHRMVEALGRMAPLRLTKSQWGTVSHIKTTGGTWSTYVSDIRRLGFLDEDIAGSGYTLTSEGFDYLGGRPTPMTGEELRDHYRRILRTGAVKMLDALVDCYPSGLSRERIGELAGVVTTGGTFSTYLSDLVRNGLAERVGGGFRATDILMKGAAA